MERFGAPILRNGGEVMQGKNNFKRILSGIMSVAMAATLLPSLPAVAEDAAEKYPYTMFAASDTEGAITINANNFCVNGNIATNGTIVSSGNMNVNGTKTENADEEMIYILKKLNYSYFSGDNVETYADDYSFEDLNININNPMDVNGTLELTGNINLNSGIKAVEDVTINGEVKNTNNSVICSETGDINIETSNVNFSGLIYAPYGDINIDTDNLNLNNVIIIGQTITIDCPSINANYSNSMAELVGTESDIEVELYAFGEYNSDANSIDMEWYTNYKNSSYEIWSSDDNVNYTPVSFFVVSCGYNTGSPFSLLQYIRASACRMASVKGCTLHTPPMLTESRSSGWLGTRAACTAFCTRRMTLSTPSGQFWGISSRNSSPP